ncbi:hypothetical protein RHMOL_Rhmol04G0220700 [Rhododendron molle]|uniref:Uncharacterized protein n=1 Tax=Rhododendron molle TaxID=49168 RepID=A0ACC0P2X9_RHOML|nr:hypothetical protein RHMOL_Rhmol04G0220700 [Rhododendron molle]
MENPPPYAESNPQSQLSLPVTIQQGKTAGLPRRVGLWWGDIPFLTSSVIIVCGVIYLVCLLVGYDSFAELCFWPLAVISRFQARMEKLIHNGDTKQRSLRNGTTPLRTDDDECDEEKGNPLLAELISVKQSAMVFIVPQKSVNLFQKGYKQASKEAKEAVRDAKLKAYDSFYARLDRKDGEKIIYKLAKSREKRARDISQVKCIKGIDSVVLVKFEAIRDRWKSYFEKLLNEKHEGDFWGEVYVPGENIEYEFYRRIQKFKVVKALKRIKPGKALGPDGIPIEVWKSLGDLEATWLTKLFNKIIMTRKMPDEWRRSTLVPIYKNKGDIQSCNNYRVMDELTRNLHEGIPWCMMFANDIVLVDETARGVNMKLEIWREALESKGFRISRSKTEYMMCKFGGTSSAHEERVMIQDQEIPKSDYFKYLGSIISSDGEIADDVTHRIQVGWLKWRSAMGVLCDKRVFTKLKGKFYGTVIRPAMLYGTESRPIKKQQVNKMSVAEMRMLRWVCGKTRRDKIRNETVHEMVGVAPIEEKLRENRLRWFGHVYHRPEDAVVKRADRIALDSNATGRGRPKLILDAVVRKDMSILVYRIFTSIVFHGSLLHVLFNMMALVPLGSELERVMGSVRLLYMIILLAASNAVFHLLIALLAAHNPFHSYQYLMDECAIGFSGILFSMIVIETSLSGVQYRSVFGLFTVPAKWYAWFLLVVFQLLMTNASLLGHLCGILSGFAYSYGLFNFLLPGTSLYSAIESSSLLWLSFWKFLEKPFFMDATERNICTGIVSIFLLASYNNVMVALFLADHVVKLLELWHYGVPPHKCYGIPIHIECVVDYN